MTDEQRTILITARTLIRQGWIQGGDAATEADEFCDYDSPVAVKFCLIGALYRARVHIPLLTPYFPYLPPLLGFERASELVAWNDDPSRTQEEVLARIDAALA